MTPEKRTRTFAHHDGHGRHLTDIYAHNTVKEVIREARDAVHHDRGKFTLPPEYLDTLMVAAEKWILEKGAADAVRLAQKSMCDFIDERAAQKLANDERKVKMRLPKENSEKPGEHK